ncbi:unnamed protein product [Mesocestoides corti]|nr:unnamed protein product [Mesocestoides corti]
MRRSLKRNIIAKFADDSLCYNAGARNADNLKFILHQLDLVESELEATAAFIKPKDPIQHFEEVIEDIVPLRLGIHKQRMDLKATMIHLLFLQRAMGKL